MTEEFLEKELADKINKVLRGHERRLLLLLYFDENGKTYTVENIRKGMAGIYATALGETSGLVLQKCFVKDELSDSIVIEALRMYFATLGHGLGEKYRYIIGRELGLNVN
jgi:hypothetical protein